MTVLAPTATVIPAGAFNTSPTSAGRLPLMSTFPVDVDTAVLTLVHGDGITVQGFAPGTGVNTSPSNIGAEPSTRTFKAVGVPVVTNGGVTQHAAAPVMLPESVPTPTLGACVATNANSSGVNPWRFALNAATSAAVTPLLITATNPGILYTY